jgi:hypothetical protein
MTTKEKKKRVEELHKHFQAFKGPMSDDEREFLKDVKGFVDYALRNGLSFSVVLSVLGHDFNGIIFHGGLAEAKERSFLPKVTGKSVLDESSVGEPGEE